MSKIKVDKFTERTLSLGKKIFLISLFFLVLFMVSCNDIEATGLTEEEKIEARERLDILIEKTEVLFLLLEDKFQRGELPFSANIPSGEPYIRGYIAFGANNDKEDVRKLQSFLNRHMNEGLLVDGFYNSATFEAVKRFQLRYANEILHPWGINEPTGFVYLTTQRKINALQNPGQYFPMPTNLVPYKKTVSYEKVASIVDKEIEPTEDEIEVEEIEQEIEEEIIIDELRTKEEEKNNIFLWIVIALSFVGFSVVVLYLFLFDGKERKSRQSNKKRKTARKEPDLEEN